MVTLKFRGGLVVGHLNEATRQIRFTYSAAASSAEDVLKGQYGPDGISRDGRVISVSDELIGQVMEDFGPKQAANG